MQDHAWRETADQLKRALGLKHEPIAITFTDQPSAGVKPFGAAVPAPTADGRTGRVPAGCVFWIQAAAGTFLTRPEDHFNCSVGSVTHGLKGLQEVMGNADVQCLLESGWVTPAEAMHLPVVQQRAEFIVYGPLAEATAVPDVVLLRISAFHAMSLHDSFPDAPIVGKPQCHIIPLAKERDQVALSTGCMLSRVRTGMSPDEMTCALPGRRLGEVIERLSARRQANTAVAAYAVEDARRFEGRASDQP